MSQTAVKQSNYRVSFILDTRNTEAVESLIERITTTLGTLQAEVSKVNNLGQKDFIRVTDRKVPNGLYLQFLLSAPSSFSSAVQERFRLDKTVNRILVESV